MKSPPTLTEITTFAELDIRVGTVVEVTVNQLARKPAYVLCLDFGPLGRKTSSAQLTENYSAEALVGRQVLAIVNLPQRQVAGIKSEVLVLAAVAPELGTVLVQPERSVANGTPIA